jgi:hypothetical protein
MILEKIEFILENEKLIDDVIFVWGFSVYYLKLLKFKYLMILKIKDKSGRTRKNLNRYTFRGT